MKFTLMSLSALFLSVALITPQTAEAKRFGGGKSFGQQKSAPFQKRQAPKQQKPDAQSTRANQATGAAATGSARWLGPLAGLAAGGLLAWMIFGEGFDGIQVMDILLLGLILFGIIAFMRARARKQEMLQPASADRETHHQVRKNMGAYTGTSSDQARRTVAPTIGADLSVSAEHDVEAPTWFDELRFVEDAKQHFVAVQAAWDKGDASEIESYCTPQLYLQLQALMNEIVVGENHTEVDTLDSEIVDLSFENDYFVVSIRFSGFIKEEQNVPAHAFNEVWHIRRLKQGEGNWQIAGIQQVTA